VTECLERVRLECSDLIVSKHFATTELYKFSAELFFGRKNKRQIERCNNRPLDLRVEIWSAGYFLSGNKFSAER
jgi:hypothetical protein